MAITTDTLNKLRAIQEKDGTRALLVHLNGLTDHRFTALYMFDAESLHNLYFFDREQPSLDSCPTIPIMASYCVFVRDSHNTFVTPDSLADERLNGHCKQLTVRSYCGVPLIGDDGLMFGTICHFDYHSIPISNESVALMEEVARFVRI